MGVECQGAGVEGMGGKRLELGSGIVVEEVQNSRHWFLASTCVGGSCGVVGRGLFMNEPLPLLRISVRRCLLHFPHRHQPSSTFTAPSTALHKPQALINLQQ